MYDNIRLLMPYPFTNEPERETFCNRFALFVKDEKKRILHNKGYESLEQNKGVYIKIELPKDRRKGSVMLSFSLHKFYNANLKKGLNNYDDFDFAKANQAYQFLKALFSIDLDMAIVKKFEVGINVVTTGNPDEYLKELSHFIIKTRELRIIEDSHFKEYKQFSTHKDRDKRIIYIFYNKTFEARSKTKDIEKRETIPENILRVERDNHRPIEKVYFRQLFDPVYQQLTKQEFRKRFTRELEFKKCPIKTKDITLTQHSIFTHINMYGGGFEGIKKHYAEQLKNKHITDRRYRWLITEVNNIVKYNIQPQTALSPQSEILKGLIISKLDEM